MTSFSLFQTQENGNAIPEAPVISSGQWVLSRSNNVPSGLSTELLVWLRSARFSSGMVRDNIWYRADFSA